MSFANNITNTVGTLGVSRGGTNLTATPTNGQLPIGNGTDYTLATLTAGSGISVTNASGSITIAATGGGGGGGFTSIVVQTFTSSGTYTPTSGMSRCIVEVVGGGGGSGGIASPGTTAIRQFISGSGGGAGYARKLFTSATIGASQTVTIGAGGTAGAAGNNAGGAGGTTEFGASPSILLQATGGAGGVGSAALNGAAAVRNAVANGVGTLGDINLSGTSFSSMLCDTVPRFWLLGAGGTSFYSLGTPDFKFIGTGVLLQSAIAGTGYGGGARGIASQTNTNQAAQAGAAGAAGIVIITEFIT